jgi:hypothetical protein
MALKDEEWEILERKALGMIRLSLAALVALNIFERKDNEGADGRIR